MIGAIAFISIMAAIGLYTTITTMIKTFKPDWFKDK